MYFLMCNFKRTGQGDMQRRDVLYASWIIECSKFLNSSSVMSEAHYTVWFMNGFELEQHPEETKLKVAPFWGMANHTSIILKGPDQDLIVQQIYAYCYVSHVLCLKFRKKKSIEPICIVCVLIL